MNEPETLEIPFGELPLEQLAAIATIGWFLPWSKQFDLYDALRAVEAAKAELSLSYEQIARGVMGGTLFIHAYDRMVRIKDTPAIED